MVFLMGFVVAALLFSNQVGATSNYEEEGCGYHLVFWPWPPHWVANECEEEEVTPTPEVTPEVTPTPTPEIFIPVVSEEDKCRNWEGVQREVPQGAAINDKFECYNLVTNSTVQPTVAPVKELPATGPSPLPLVGGLMILGSGLSFWLMKRGLEE